MKDSLDQDLENIEKFSEQGINNILELAGTFPQMQDLLIAALRHRLSIELENGNISVNLVNDLLKIFTDQSQQGIYLCNTMLKYVNGYRVLLTEKEIKEAQSKHADLANVDPVSDKVN